MSRMNANVVAALAGGLLLPLTALAQPVLQERCASDSLDITQGRERVEWARTCGLLRNVRNPNGHYLTNPEEAEAGLPALYDYIEPVSSDGRNAYAGSVHGFNINESYIQSLYGSGAIYQSKDANGYYKWTKLSTRLKPQPQYPTFGATGNLYDPANKQLYRNPRDPTDCTLYSDVGATIPATNFFINGYCVASCYTPEQEVLFSDGYAPILDAVNARKEDLVTLAPDATLDAPTLKVNRTYSYVAELRDFNHRIYDIRTASGGLLRVTGDHGVLRSDGRMVQAHTLKAGQELLKADGTPDSIASISTSQHFGKVYNLRPVSDDLISNVVVAQGYLVGSSQFQNDFVRYINRSILHKHIPHEVIP
jgi:hypothetical protein